MSKAGPSVTTVSSESLFPMERNLPTEQRQLMMMNMWLCMNGFVFLPNFHRFKRNNHPFQGSLLVEVVTFRARNLAQLAKHSTWLLFSFLLLLFVSADGYGDFATVRWLLLGWTSDDEKWRSFERDTRCLRAWMIFWAGHVLRLSLLDLPEDVKLFDT